MMRKTGAYGEVEPELFILLVQELAGEWLDEDDVRVLVNCPLDWFHGRSALEAYEHDPDAVKEWLETVSRMYSASNTLTHFVFRDGYSRVGAVSPELRQAYAALLAATHSMMIAVNQQIGDIQKTVNDAFHLQKRP